jgi:hypothetical protein
MKRKSDEVPLYSVPRDAAYCRIIDIHISEYSRGDLECLRGCDAMAVTGNRSSSLSSMSDRRYRSVVGRSSVRELPHNRRSPVIAIHPSSVRRFSHRVPRTIRIIRKRVRTHTRARRTMPRRSRRQCSRRRSPRRDVANCAGHRGRIMVHRRTRRRSLVGCDPHRRRGVPGKLRRCGALRRARTASCILANHGCAALRPQPAGELPQRRGGARIRRVEWPGGRSGAARGSGESSGRAADPVRRADPASRVAGRPIRWPAFLCRDPGRW